MQLLTERRFRELDPLGDKMYFLKQLLGSKQSVIVTVNDYGPNRKKYPTRVIDLDAVAFKKLGSLSQGMLAVKVEKI